MPARSSATRVSEEPACRQNKDHLNTEMVDLLHHPLEFGAVVICSRRTFLAILLDHLQLVLLAIRLELADLVRDG
jgi:hypothetical protein